MHVHMAPYWQSCCTITMTGRSWTIAMTLPTKRAHPTPSWSLSLTRLAEALRYLHNEAAPGFQLLHRDLKPDNMGFRADGSLVRHDPLPRVALTIQNLISKP
jgi:serine/threonine protein kinase